MAKAPADAHEWVSFEDEDEERTWRFDVTFLESSWHCIFGNGCQGVLTGPASELVQGCCSYGAHLLDDDDVERVLAQASRLTEDDWQHLADAPDQLIVTNDEGETVTALIDDACCFLNRPGFAAGPGCALHVAAERAGESFVSWKPEVCWQLPLRREDEVGDDEHVTTSIGQWDRRHWGDGGFEFHWWCTEAPEAFSGTTRVVDSLRDELVEMVGARTYERLVAYLDERRKQLAKGVAIPHPALRKKKASKGSAKR